MSAKLGSIRFQPHNQHKQRTFDRSAAALPLSFFAVKRPYCGRQVGRDDKGPYRMLSLFAVKTKKRTQSQKVPDPFKFPAK